MRRRIQPVVVSDEVALAVQRDEARRKAIAREATTTRTTTNDDLVATIGKTKRKRIEFVPAASTNGSTESHNSENGLPSSSHLANGGAHYLHPALDDVPGITQWPKRELGGSWGEPGKGLLNLGTTCFLNAVLQCLAHCVPFLREMLRVEDCEVEDALSRVKRHLLLCFEGGGNGNSNINGTINGLMMKKKKQRFVNPNDLLAAVRKASNGTLRRGRQEDAHEALRVLLEDMQRACLRRAGRRPDSTDRLSETTLVHRLFGGAFESETRCPACGHASVRRDAFLDLSLEIKLKGEDTLPRALANFCREERLDENNLWECDACKRKVRATRRVSISQSPLCLVIHLKRFGFFPVSSKAGGGYAAGKLKTAVRTDLELELGEGVIYDLAGMVVHFGYGAHSGHYVANVKAGNGLWYEADDESVRRLKTEAVRGEKQGYLLFYVRRERPGSSTTPSSLSSQPPAKTMDASRIPSARETMTSREAATPRSDAMSETPVTKSSVVKEEEEETKDSTNKWSVKRLRLDVENDDEEEEEEKSAATDREMRARRRALAKKQAMTSSSPRSRDAVSPPSPLELTVRKMSRLFNKEANDRVRCRTALNLAKRLKQRRRSSTSSSSSSAPPSPKSNELLNEPTPQEVERKVAAKEEKEEETTFSFEGSRPGVDETRRRPTFAESRRAYDVVDRILDAGKLSKHRKRRLMAEAEEEEEFAAKRRAS